MKNEYPQLPPSQFEKVINNLAGNEIILDVRTPAEFSQDRLDVEDSARLINIDVNQLINRTDFSEFSGKKVYLICESGARSGLAQQFLVEAGINAVNMSGGMTSARRLGLV